jgi:hypothetical protein
VEDTNVKLIRSFLIVALIGAAVSFALFSANAQGRRGGGQGGPPAGAQAGEGGPERPSDPMSSPTFGGLRFRSIGPAVVGGRVIAFAVDPNDRAKFFIAVASGGVWKTVNGGTTWTPVFDNYGSFSIGAVTLDQKDTNIVWVGTGERNSQRSVGYGDGVYKSEDGGRSFRKVGLDKSEHIGRIAIDPRDSKTVYVAAQGPLWSAGGDRGLYKTTDGGKTWKAVLTISENTGVTDVVIDPSNPDIVYAASWQRRRHFYTLINGGPESAIHKSTDGGATWTKLRGGLPAGDIGRVGLAISPAGQQRRLRHGRSRRTQAAAFSALQRQRRDLGANESHHRSGHVLRPDHRRPEKRGSRLHPQRGLSGLRRRRQNSASHWANA